MQDSLSRKKGYSCLLMKKHTKANSLVLPVWLKIASLWIMLGLGNRSSSFITSLSPTVHPAVDSDSVSLLHLHFFSVLLPESWWLLLAFPGKSKVKGLCKKGRGFGDRNTLPQRATASTSKKKKKGKWKSCFVTKGSKHFNCCCFSSLSLFPLTLFRPP